VEEGGTAIFRLPRLWQAGFFALVMFGPCGRVLIYLSFGMSVRYYLIEVFVLVVFWIFFLRCYTVQVRPDGIKLFSLWWLPWADVSDVHYQKVLGLSYFRVKRCRGFSWSIPLYFAGDRDLGQAIIHAAPLGNPFRLVTIPS
jgi:hypothetical protein